MKNLLITLSLLWLVPETKGQYFVNNLKVIEDSLSPELSYSNNFGYINNINSTCFCINIANKEYSGAVVVEFLNNKLVPINMSSVYGFTHAGKIFSCSTVNLRSKDGAIEVDETEVHRLRLRLPVSQSFRDWVTN